jgi:hypothetical protein
MKFTLRMVCVGAHKIKLCCTFFTVIYTIQDLIKIFQVASERKYEDGETVTSL